MDGHEAARRDAAGIFLSFRSAEARGPLDRAPWLATLAAVLLVLSLGACSESTSPPIQTPAALAFVVQPGGGAGGTPFTAQAVVEIRDASGAIVSTATTAVTVRLETDTAGATLTGTVTVDAVAGKATFTDLTIDKVGSYTLAASAAGLDPAVSNAFAVAPGAPSRLPFATQPAGAAGGTPFTTQPVVEVLDAVGNRVTGPSVSVTLTLGANPHGGYLSGTTTVTTTTGVASFTDLTIDTAATGYTLVATSTGTSPDTSATFDVLPGAASALRFAGQPAGATGGTPFTTQPVVAILDAVGNRVAGPSVSVTLTLGANPHGGHLSGTTTVTTTTGVASFSDLAIDTAATGYTLVTTSTGTRPDTSTAFDVAPGTASRLLFTAQPAGAVGGTAFTTQPVVVVLDAVGNRVAGASLSVTLALGTNPHGGHLSGTTTVTTTTGVASFSDLAIDTAVTGYTLVATSSGTSPDTSATFDVLPGAASALRFAGQPAGATGGTAFTTQPVVAILDAVGNRVAGPSLNVTLALGANPHHGHLTGTTSVTTTTGLASFTDLTIDSATTGYTLVASGPGTVPDTSDAFDVAIGPAALNRSVVTADHALVVPQDTVIVKLTTRDAGGNALPQGGLAVSFTATGGTSQATWDPTVDNGDGTYTTHVVGQVAGTPLTVGATIAGVAVTTPAPVVRVVTFTTVSVGTVAATGFACGLLTNGTAYCWGDDVYGELGNGAVASSFPIPQAVLSSSWSSVDAGAFHACGLNGTGTAACWGSGDAGALGNGSSGHGSADGHDSPVTVADSGTWMFLRAGYDVTCGITTADDAYCWGRNALGRLGTGTDTSANLPERVAGGYHWGSVDMGSGNGCGITVDSTAYCWGSADYMAPGGTDDCSGTPCALAPLPVPGSVSFRPRSIVVGGNHACALAADGTALCWGSDSDGQLGDGSSETYTTTPTVVGGGFHFAQLTAGDIHTCGVTDAGDALCWGANGTGQLGNGTYAGATSPQPVSGGIPFTAISAGQTETCAVAASGAAYCWGQGQEGQLGDGVPMASRSTPTEVKLP